MSIKQSMRVQIGGQERLIKFGTNASALYCDKHDISLSEYSESLASDRVKPSNLRDLIWSGLVAGCYYEGKEVKFDEYRVGDWIDELDQQTIDKIFSLLMGDSGNVEAGKS